ncbi:MAG: DUF2141 domain-containing protein [Gammaproteobacteria bacterium]|nr:DUF2141 domain-containing protein [Gammaproteobacteria bacterium]
MNKLGVKLFLSMFLLSIASASMAASLTIHVRALNNDTGLLRMALFEQSQQELFPKHIEKARYQQSARIENQQAVIQLHQLPPGRYAAFVFHDEDNDQIMDHNWIGFPQELFGFVKNYQVKMLPPKFDEVAFDVQKENLQFEIQLQDF